MIIYKISNKINNKIYIGKTIGSLEKRFNRHLRTVEYNYNSALYSAMKKYGKENFYIEIIEKCNDIDELNKKEQYYIEFYNSYCPNGYNIAKGGFGGDTYSNNPNKESIRLKHKISSLGNKNGFYGKKHSEEFKHKLSKERKGIWKGYWTGKKRSEETKRKISETKLKNKLKTNE